MRARIERNRGDVIGECIYLEERPQTNRRHRRALFQCRCGNTFETNITQVISGKTKSCGCLNKSKILDKKTHFVWCHLKDRCFNPKHPYYKNYGGRGITVHEPWINDYQAFYDYVKDLPNYGVPGLSIDRRDNDGNYEPENLRWATAVEQNNNRTNNVRI